MNKEKWVILVIVLIMFCAMLTVFYHLVSASTTTKISLFSGFAGLLAILLAQYSISQRNIQEAHRKKKTEIYIEFLDLMATTIQSNEKERIKNNSKIQKSMMQFKTNIILWGSPEVIICYLAYEKPSRKKDNKSVFLAVDNLYIAMRKDIGLSNKGLSKYDLVKMYLKDPSELDNL